MLARAERGCVCTHRENTHTHTERDIYTYTHAHTHAYTHAYTQRNIYAYTHAYTAHTHPHATPTHSVCVIHSSIHPQGEEAELIAEQQRIAAKRQVEEKHAVTTTIRKRC